MVLVEHDLHSINAQILKGVFLQHIFLITIVSFGILTVSCKSQEYDSVKSNSLLSQGVAAEVNPMAFNALKIWGGDVAPDGTPIKEILEYPTVPLNYRSYQGKVVADEVFYSGGIEYSPTSIAPPSGTSVGNVEMGYPKIQLTKGLRVEKDGEDEILVYPVNQKSGRSLRLRFSKEDPKVSNQDAAVNYCAGKNLRLPTSREVFDFCTAETPNLLKGNNYKAEYPETGRCAKRFVLSATIDDRILKHSFRFEGYTGLMKIASRSPNASFDPGSVTRCVGR